jgi:hypothetical protein
MANYYQKTLINIQELVYTFKKHYRVSSNKKQIKVSIYI